MADGAMRERWSHTSSLMALHANLNRDPRKGKRFTPEDFDPFSRGNKRKPPAIPADITVLRDVFCPQVPTPTT